jgi:hypothetical protein
LTVEELIEELKKFHPKDRVAVCSDGEAPVELVKPNPGDKCRVIIVAEDCC